MMRKLWTRTAAVLAALAMIATLLLAPGSSAEPAAIELERDGPPQDWYLKYDGIEGESVDADHKGWVDVLSMSWGADRGDKDAASGTGINRQAQAANVNELVLTFEYEQTSPQVLEALLVGRAFPTLEVEMETLGAEDGGTTYLRYELTNVVITSYDVGGAAADGSPLVTVANSFEEVRVTYMGRDARGRPRADIETSYNVRTGTRGR